MPFRCFLYRNENVTSLDVWAFCLSPHSYNNPISNPNPNLLITLRIVSSKSRKRDDFPPIEQQRFVSIYKQSVLLTHSPGKARGAIGGMDKLRQKSRPKIAT